MRWLVAVVQVGLLVACSGGGPPLHERGSFSGDVELHVTKPDGRPGGVISGEFAFDRRESNFQWTERGPGPVRAMVWLPPAGAQSTDGVQAFRDGSPSPADPARVTQFHFARALLMPDPKAAPELVDGTSRDDQFTRYRVMRKGARIEIRFREREVSHGRR